MGDGQPFAGRLCRPGSQGCGFGESVSLSGMSLPNWQRASRPIPCPASPMMSQKHRESRQRGVSVGNPHRSGAPLALLSTTGLMTVAAGRPSGLATRPVIAPVRRCVARRGRSPQRSTRGTMSATATKSVRKKSTLIPLGDRVVVEREEGEQKTAGGILLPDSAKDKPARGVVVSAGRPRGLHELRRRALQGGRR